MDFIKYFNQILSYDTSVRHGQIEELGQEALLPFKLKYTGQHVIIYGSGSMCCYILGWLKFHSVKVDFIVDADPKKEGQSLLGVEIKNVAKMPECFEKDIRYLAIIGTSFVEDYCQIERMLYLAGVQDVVKLKKDNFFQNEANWQYYFIQNRDKLYKILKELSDDESKETLCEYVRTFFMDDFYRLNQHPSAEKYFGKGIFTQDVNETFLCIGGSTGDTIFYFLEQYNYYDKIICFEGEPNGFRALSTNVQVIPNSIRSHIELVPLYVGSGKNKNTISIDEYVEDNGIRPTLISMDIEGMEMEALDGLRKLMKTCRPILALSAYHKKEDIISFSEYIAENAGDYSLYLRKYGSRHTMSKNEIVWYAVPNERVKIN